MGGVTKYYQSKMACCIIRVSSSSSASMHKVTTNVQRASLGALLGVTGNDGFEREGSKKVVWTRRLKQIMFCKRCEKTDDIFIHLCSNDYTDQNTQCGICTTSRSEHDFDNSDPPKKLRHARRKLIPTTRGLRRVLFSHQ